MRSLAAAVMWLYIVGVPLVDAYAYLVQGKEASGARLPFEAGLSLLAIAGVVMIEWARRRGLLGQRK